MIWIIHYLRKSIIFSVSIALLCACAGADDLSSVTPETVTPVVAKPDATSLVNRWMQYQAIEITGIKAVDVFPQLLHIEGWDPNIYEYIKDLRVAEAYVMREMMTRYGTDKYTPEQYQQLLSRMNIGLIQEVWEDYQNYGWIWPAIENPYISDHAKHTSQNLYILKWDHTNVWNLSGLPDGDNWAKNLSEYAEAHPNDIFIFSRSTLKVVYSQSEYPQKVYNQDIVDLCNLPNVIIFVGWGDTETIDWVPIKKVYNGVYESHWDWMHNDASMANSDKNNFPDSNMRVIIWRNANWNADMTNSQGSVVPVWFNKKSLVSGHPILPMYNWYKWSDYWKLYGQILPKNGTYPVSFPTPAIASETQLIFGLCADVKDADELLEMIESNTANPDHISLNWETWEIQKYSPANFVKKYLMPTELPSELNINETKELSKGSYKGVVFNIPGAEVLIDGEWIACTEQNAAQIKAQNPFSLEWRLNGDLCRQYGYEEGKTIEGTIILVDDQYNGMNISLPISVTLMDSSTGIRPVYVD